MLANIFGDWYWVVFAVIVLFGGSQLPKLARNSGEALKEFRKAHSETTEPAPQVASRAAQVLPPSPPVVTPPVAHVPASEVVAPTAEERVTLSRAELDALLAAREAQARAERATGPGAPA